MRFVSETPIYIGRGQRGIWRVTAIYQDGRVNFADYEAFTKAEAKRRYLMEFGKVRGEIHAEIIQKVLDKSPNPCYNTYRK
jgi:hypothetical protein